MNFDQKTGLSVEDGSESWAPLTNEIALGVRLNDNHGGVDAVAFQKNESSATFLCELKKALAGLNLRYEMHLIPAVEIQNGREGNAYRVGIDFTECLKTPRTDRGTEENPTYRLFILDLTGVSHV